MSEEISKLSKIVILISTITVSCYPGFSNSIPEQPTHQVGVTISAPLPECPARHITKAIVASDGMVWVASEKSGAYRFALNRPGSGSWEHAGEDEGYPQTGNFYALAEDGQGRIWAGTDNMGVAVFNGKFWKTFDRSNALLGERIFDIAVSPLTGEVALASSGGVTIYHPANETWKDFTRAEGLVEDQVSCLKFTSDGSLWVGYACGGVSKASPENGYKTWETTQARWFWDDAQRVRQPVESRGEGLPSNLCNTLCVGQSGTIWLGTNSGLGYLAGGGQWKFVRGNDYIEKNRGIYGGDVSGKEEQENAATNDLLPEDFVTCLFETADGLWVGTRSKGAALVDPRSLNVIRYAEGDESHNFSYKWITSFVPFPDGTLYASTYGDGLILIDKGTGDWNMTGNTIREEASHPVIPAVPEVSQLSGELEKLAESNDDKPAANALYWKDDWSTQGNWCGRYGENYALLCAANAPRGNEEYSFHDEYRAMGIIGAHRRPDELMRHRVYWVNEKNNSNVLYCPTDATRCEAKWIDLGYTYPATHDGPDLWSVVRVPEGRQIVSLYFYNPEGVGNESAAKRDYLIEVRKYQPNMDEDLFLKVKSGKNRKALEDMRVAEMEKAVSEQVLARTRVREFNGCGVYKTFLVEGPGLYLFRICKNYSSDTTLNGVFVERVDKNHPDNMWANRGHFHFYDVYPKAPVLKEGDKFVNAFMEKRRQCDFHFPASLSNFEKNNIYLHRYASAKLDDELVSITRWYMNEWSHQDREQFRDLMKRSWDHKQEVSPAYRSATFMPNAPNVIPFSLDEVIAMERLKINWKQYLPTYVGEPDIPARDLHQKLAEEIKRFKQQQFGNKPAAGPLILTT